MSATDELRRLLDEHGVEWRAGEIMTFTDSADYMPTEIDKLNVSLFNLTPEQAVEATLGRGACRVVSSMDMTDAYEYAPTSYWHFEMTCGGVFDWTEPEPPSFCPCCGAKVVDV